MNDVQTELRSYYEEEARQRLRRAPRGRRVDVRSEFINLLANEDRHKVLDLGAGPGGDGSAFIEAGHRYVGLDLANGNAVLAAAAGVTVVHGSISAPPFAPRSFDAGWCMSTLMHVPEDQVPATFAAMVLPLKIGAPLIIGIWGGDRRDIVIGNDTNSQRRLFSLRPIAHNRDLIETSCTIEQASNWDLADDGQQYQLFKVRVGAAS